MSKFEKSFYKLISFSRNKVSLNIFNFITNNDDYTLIKRAAENDKKPLASIIAYRQSKSHESKQLLAEKLIQALKIAGVTVRENGDIADIAKAIMEKLPNPHKGQSYKVESESQKNVLKALVKGLNDSFSPGASADLKFIPTTYGLEEIARQAMELVYSMTTGVHDEFLTVPLLIMECTGFSDDDCCDCCTGKHIHVNDLTLYHHLFENNKIVLFHFSQQYKQIDQILEYCNSIPESFKNKLLFFF